MDSKELSSGVMYKKMSINDKYRTKDVKRLILEKFFLNPEQADNYTLVQILGPGNGELVINDNCNVFYAAKSVPDMQFVLRSKTATHTATKNLPSSFSSSANMVVLDSSMANGSGGSGGSAGNAAYYGGNSLRNQAKFTRHSLANLNNQSSTASATGPYAQLPPQPNGKPSKWWLKKILS